MNNSLIYLYSQNTFSNITRESLFNRYTRLCHYDTEYLNKNYARILTFFSIGQVAFFFLCFNKFLLKQEESIKPFYKSNKFRFFFLVVGSFIVRSKLEYHLFEKSFDQKYPGTDQASLNNIDLIFRDYEKERLKIKH